MSEKRTVLVTGSAGFIGYWLSLTLLEHGFQVVGIDNMSDYYDVTLKERRHAMLLQNPGFSAHIGGVEDETFVNDLVAKTEPDVIVHLAGQAGVRYSIDAPREYVTANLIGTFNVMEAAKAQNVDHLLMASTSSAYGANTKMPYVETDKADAPMSFYAATKRANEAMGHSYAHLFDIPTTMFRFFTVYGPWGRPDMALFKFTKAILNGDPIDVYNHGNMKRDFTYVADLVEGIRLLIDTPPVRQDSVPEGDSLSPVAPFRVVNIGNADPVSLGDYISAIESATGITAKKNMMDMQPGDVPATWADTSLLRSLTGFQPKTDVQTGVSAFVAWYRDYYGVS